MLEKAKLFTWTHRESLALSATLATAVLVTKKLYSNRYNLRSHLTSNL